MSSPRRRAHAANEAVDYARRDASLDTAMTTPPVGSTGVDSRPMRIRTGFEIVYECPCAVPMLLMLSVHPSRRGDLETLDAVRSDPPVPSRAYTDAYGNICSRLVAPPGRMRLSTDFIIRDLGLIDPYVPDAAEQPIQELPDEVILYLLGSRYCDTDRLADIAWALFGQTPPGWARVQAISDYVHNHITFNYANARPDKTAYDAWTEATGVCRDYAHLAIALCRCLNIPARYCTGYMGDIGVPVVGVMDFSAWMEVYLGGRWRTFDPRNNMPRMARVLIARGRDAIDVPIATTFGPATLTGFDVTSVEVASPL
jgi:transglutaminase-like putative cysteine protease